MVRRVAMTAGNSNISYRAAAVPVDEPRDSGGEGARDSMSPEIHRQRFPGWLRLVIIAAGAALSWGLVAFALGWLR